MLNLTQAIEKARNPQADFASIERGLREWFATMTASEIKAELQSRGMMTPRGRRNMEDGAVAFVGHLSSTAVHAAIIAE